MKKIIIYKSGNYITHGVGDTNHEGSGTVSDHKNRVSIKNLIKHYKETYKNEAVVFEINHKITEVI